MKLYTEEQVRATWNTAFMEGMSIDSEIYEPIFFEDYLNSLTPIELPSDDEIEQYLKSFPYTKHLDDGQYNDGKIAGAELAIQWMRDKIQEDNNAGL